MARERSDAQATTDHKTIRKWAEARGGKPAAVKATHRKDDAGILRIIFPDSRYADDENLEEITWDEFFEKFDEAGLALLYQEKTKDGEVSAFNKLVSRENGETRPASQGTSSRRGER
jgi:hypothetical protein